MPNADSRRVVIAGASLAGTRAAEALRSAGFTGRITMVGQEPHLPYDRPPLSKQVLAGDWDPVRTELRPPAEYTDLDIEHRLGTSVEGVDIAGRVLATSTGPVAFDGLVIATGTRVRMLPGTDATGHVYVVRTLDDCRRLRSAFEAGPRVVVVGAGFIGAEVAATAHGRGLDVTVVEAAPLPLVPQLGPEMAAVCAGLHGRHGVTLRTGVGVEEVGADGLVLSDGSVIDAEVVVVGIGVAPNTEWLDGSGLAVTNGVVCDDTCRVRGTDGAPVAGVVAAGDVARWPNPLYEHETDMRIEHWTNAAEMGAHAAVTLLADLDGEPGRATPYAPVPYFWSDQYKTKIQFLGRSTGYDEVRIVKGDPAEHKVLALYRRGERLVGALGLTMIRDLIGYRRMLAERAGWNEALTHAGVT